MSFFESPIKQIHWRIAGGVCVAACAVMALTATQWPILRESLVWFCLYWLGFLVLLFVTLYCVLLDIRYIRVEYAMERRDIFKDTLGDEEFRKSLREAQGRAVDERTSREDRASRN